MTRRLAVALVIAVVSWTSPAHLCAQDVAPDEDEVDDEGSPLPDIAAHGEPLQRYLGLLDGLGAAVRSTHSDCAALATSVDTWVTAHGADFVAAHEALAADPPDLDADPELRQDVERRVGRTLDVLTEATLSCAEHAEASAALERVRLLLRTP